MRRGWINALRNELDMGARGLRAFGGKVQSVRDGDRVTREGETMPASLKL